MLNAVLWVLGAVLMWAVTGGAEFKDLGKFLRWLMIAIWPAAMIAGALMYLYGAVATRWR